MSKLDRKTKMALKRLLLNDIASTHYRIVYNLEHSDDFMAHHQYKDKQLNLLADRVIKAMEVYL